MTHHPSGTFCWADLATTDAAAAMQFYTTLFGWTATDVPAGAAGTYTMLAATEGTCARCMPWTRRCGRRASLLTG
jgi:hypothetical protein